jgi:hypothetical protein
MKLLKEFGLIMLESIFDVKVSLFGLVGTMLSYFLFQKDWSSFLISAIFVAVIDITVRKLALKK